MGLQFDFIFQDVDEIIPDHIPAHLAAEYLANLKAAAVNDQLKIDEFVIAADTTVVLNGTIYNKPKDRADAVYILKQLSGNAHQVITGVAVQSKSQKVSFSAAATVYFNVLSNTEIDYYIDHFKPFDKAGAYGIQEWIGLCKIQRIEGNYNTIVGLPTAELYETLLALNIIL